MHTGSAFRPRLAMALLCGFAALALYVLFAGTASFSDEGSVCTIAQGILAGEQPYTHYFNEKAPLQYYWAALVMSLTHTLGIDGTRIASSITFALTLVLLMHGANASRSTGRAALFALTVTMAGLSMRAFNGTSESSLALLHLASVWLALRAPWPVSRQATGFVLGVLQGLAIGFRQQSMAVALCFLCQPAARFDRKAYVVGVLAGCLGWVLWLHAAGALTAYIGTHQALAESQPFAHGYWHRPDRNDAAALLGLGLLGTVLLRAPGRARIKLWALALTLCAAIPFLGRMDAFRLWPAFVVLLACATIPITNASNGPPRSVLGLLAATGILWMLLATPLETQARYSQLSQKIQQLSLADERIWVGPYDPNVYCHAQRKPASRFYFMLPWISSAGNREALRRDLEANPPTLIVTLTGKHFDWHDTAPALPALLERDYRPVCASNGFVLHQRQRNAGLPQTPATDAAPRPSGIAPTMLLPSCAAG